MGLDTSNLLKSDFQKYIIKLEESVVDLMSMDYGGSARLVLQDEKTAIYEYSPYDLNKIEYRNNERIYDGLITISKDGLVEPDIHEKLKRMPSGRKKLVVKRVRRDVNYRELLLTEKVIIENNRYCWRFVGTDNNIGMVAMKLVFHIFDQYQYDGVLPEVMNLNY